MANPHGSFIWYELITPDAAAAQAFYAPVIGWNIAEFDSAQPGYRVISAPDGAGIGGILPMPDMHPGWLGYFGVDDVDATVDAIVASGGTVHRPAWDMEGVGRLALVADPQDVLFYVMRGASEETSTAYARMAQGHVSWNELETTDADAALDFYGKTFSYTKQGAMPMGEMGEYSFIAHGGDPEPIGAIMNQQQPGLPPAWGFYFRVDEIEAAKARVEKAGGTVAFGPMEVPGGEWVLVGIDPQGAKFGLVAPAKEA